jgi:hypothetical protein
MALTTASLRSCMPVQVCRRHLSRWEPGSIVYYVESLAGMKFGGRHLWQDPEI